MYTILKFRILKRKFVGPIQTVWRDSALKDSGGYLLVRPEEGWNDQFVQIYKCLKYAQATGRKLIVDTDYPGRLGADFGHFFSFLDTSVIYRGYDVGRVLAELNAGGRSFYPADFSGRLFEYEAKFDKSVREYTEAGRRLSIDFRENYPAQVLVHHTCGGGAGWELFPHIHLSDHIRRLVLERRATLPKNYVGVQIRNTDMQSDRLTAFVGRLRRIAQNKSILIATDDVGCREMLIEESKHFASLHFFSQLPADRQPLHFLRPKAERLQFATDALCDLFLLASAEEVWCSNMKSGYAKLAVALNMFKSKLWDSDLNTRQRHARAVVEKAA